MPGQGWTIGQVARALKVSEKTIRRRIERGDLAAYRIPRGRGYEWRIDLAALGFEPAVVAALSPESGRSAGDEGTEAVVGPLLELLKEKDRQILELANQLGVWQERARSLEDELRGQLAESGADARRSWVRRLLG